MADLKTIYDEDGIQGILPYAFNSNEPGYKFLCDVLKAGYTLWFLVGQRNNMPFLEVVESKLYFSFFTTEEEAHNHADTLARHRYYTTPIKTETDTAFDLLWKRSRDLGATHINIDQAVWINIKDLAPVAEYDGYISADAPIRNAKINSLMLLFNQQISADIKNDRLTAELWRALQDSRFYVPLMLTEEIEPGKAMTDDNSSPHTINYGEGLLTLPVFTDQAFLTAYAQAFELPDEAWAVVKTPDLKEILNYTRNNAQLAAIINPCSLDLLLSKDAIEEFERIALVDDAQARS